MKFQHKLTINAVTGHVEKAGQEDGDLGISLSLSGSVKLSDLVPVIGCEHTAQLLDHLYNAEGTPHTENVVKTSLKVEHKDVEAVISIGAQRHKFKDAVLDSVVIVPALSRVIEVTARLKVHPTEAQSGWLLVNLRKDVIVTLTGGKTIIAAKSKGDEDGQPQMALPDQPPPARGGKKANGAAART